MPKLGLRPFAVLEEGLEGYLSYNFNRLENVFERIDDVTSGSISVAGSLTFATGLTTVSGAVACLSSSPSVNAAYVACTPQSGGTIQVRVYNTGMALSIVGVTVQWVATGELTLA